MFVFICSEKVEERWKRQLSKLATVVNLPLSTLRLFSNAALSIPCKYIITVE